MKSITQRMAEKQARKRAAEEKQEAKKKSRVVEYSLKHGKSKASRQYRESLSNIKRWAKIYEGTWKSLLPASRRPHSHSNQHTLTEEADISDAWREHGKKGVQYVYSILVKKYAYKRTEWGLYHALRRLRLIEQPIGKGRRSYRQCTPCEIPGEKIQIDVKEVPYYCIRGQHRRDEKKMYQWTAIDECTRWRFVYGFDEHTPENSVKFLEMLIERFPFEIMTIQTDNGTEFTYKFISDEVLCPFEEKLGKLGIKHKLIKPRTPWHNGKVERSHRMDQRYFYEWEHFRNMDEFNEKLKEHMEWSNDKPMRIFKGKSPREKLLDYIWLI